MKLSKNFVLEYSYTDLTQKSLRTPSIKVDWNLDSDVEVSDDFIEKLKNEITKQKSNKGKINLEIGCIYYNKIAYDNWKKQLDVEGRERLSNMDLDALSFNEHELRNFYTNKAGTSPNIDC